jgi:YbbR domain-containing protein
MGWRVRNWLHSTFVENWPVKLLSLIVAVILWMHVLRTEDPEDTQAITAQVVPVNEPQGLKTIDVTPETVELRLRGRERALQQAQIGRIRMEANLRNAKVGENQVPLRIEGDPLTIRVLAGYPTTATVVLDKVIERKRPVHDLVRGEPARGFVIEEVEIAPEEVTVRGATSVVREVARAVAVIDVSGINQSASFDVELEARDNRNVVVSNVVFEPETVTVSVDVRELNVKYVPVRPVLGRPPSGYTVTGVRTEPEIVTVTSEEGLADLRTVPTLLVDISGLRGTKQYSVALNVPPEMHVEGPASVQVTVTTRRLGSTSPPPPEPEPAEAGDETAETGAEEGNPAGAENQDTDAATGSDGASEDNDSGDSSGGSGTGEEDAGSVGTDQDGPADEQDNSATTPAPEDGVGT